jgi:hypothetical protein
MDEQELHAYAGQPAKRAGAKHCTPDDDTAAHFSQCDDESDVWTLDVYHDRHNKALVKLGCKPLRSTHADGKLYKLTAQELIQFIAHDAGLNVEFPKRKKAQLSPEALEAKRQRMKALNAAQRGGSTSMNGV